MLNLIKTVNKETGKQVVILIDEYDAPLLDVVHEETSLDILRNVMRNFYSPLKDCEKMLRFVFLTGITKDELLTQMSEDIDRLAEKNGLSREETINRLKLNYDGYHFTWPYSPFSLLNRFAEGKFNPIGLAPALRPT